MDYISSSLKKLCLYLSRSMKIPSLRPFNKVMAQDPANLVPRNIRGWMPAHDAMAHYQ
jgi:hypothetical protein